MDTSGKPKDAVTVNIEEVSPLLGRAGHEQEYGGTTFTTRRAESDEPGYRTRSLELVNRASPSLRILGVLWLLALVAICVDVIYDAHFKSVEQRVQDILRAVPVIDSHIDLPILIRFLYQNKIYGQNFTSSFESGPLYGQVDVPRLHDGRVGGVFWSVFTSCPAESADPDEEFKDEVYYQSIHDTLQQIDVVKRMVGEFSDDFAIARTVADLRAVWKGKSDMLGWRKRQRKVASMLGVEGLHQIGNSPSVMRLYYELGVRYITLNHNCNNNYSDGALVPAPHWNGLNPATGPALIYEMNRIGMLVDLSHTSAATMRDVLAITRAPVIYSHSSAFAVCGHPRNVPDDVLQLVKRNGGVVMVNFYPGFIRCGDGKESSDATIDDVVEHMVYIGTLIGWEYVGIGSDFDGIESVPDGLEDVSKYPKLFEELLKRGVTDREARGIAGENVLRVWEGAEKVSREMKAAGAAVLEDEVPKMHF